MAIEDKTSEPKELMFKSKVHYKRFIEFRENLLNDRDLCRQHGIYYPDPDMAQVNIVAYEYVNPMTSVAGV